MSKLLQDIDMKSMKDSLQSYLLKTPEEGEEEEEERGNDNKVKTYIVESNISDPRGITYWPHDSSLKETSDPHLWTINIPKDGQFLYLDCSDSRFWLLHTYSKSGIVEDFVERWITKDRSKLDYCWFSSNFLENKCSIGTGSGFGVKYYNSFLENPDEIEEKSLHRFSMLFWGGRPSDVLAGLKNNKDLVSAISLSRVKRVLQTADGFVKENIHSHGKFTLTKGNSIDTHLLSVDKIKRNYSTLVHRVEEDYRIKFIASDNGFNIRGSYVLIKLKKTIENMEIFLNNFLSCNLPFRIFGIPQFESKDFIKVAAVDLHTYDKFNMEIAPDYIRVYLHQNSCGNVITRLMTNLQQFYDSQIEVWGCDNEQLI